MSGAELTLPTDPQPNVAPVAPDWTGYLITRSGFEFFTRPARPADEHQLGLFFEKVTAEDLRFRFLSSVARLSQDQLEAMTAYDRRTSENFLAYDKDHKSIFATAMLAADPKLETAEIAIAILPDYKNRGASWTLLKHIARFARSRGIATIESIESRDNHAAIELERDMGFRAVEYPGDPSLVIVRADLAGMASRRPR